MQQEVAEQINSLGQVVAQYCSIIHGVLLVGESIEVAPNTFQAVEHLQRRTAFCSLEGDMLAEMGKSLLVGSLVSRTSIHSESAEDDRRWVLQVYHSQSVGKSMGVVSHFGAKVSQKSDFTCEKSFFRLQQ